MELKKKASNISSTDLYFFDTDALSCFLCIDEEYILPLLFDNRIIIPKQVYMEICRARKDNGVLKTRLDRMIKNKQAVINDIEYPTREFDLYQDFINGNNQLKIAIGKGEAACLSMAIERKGTIVSNNLKDVKDFVGLFNLKHMTTVDILKKAYSEKIISEDNGNRIFQKMKENSRKIGPYKSFSHCLKSG